MHGFELAPDELAVVQTLQCPPWFQRVGLSPWPCDKALAARSTPSRPLLPCRTLYTEFNGEITTSLPSGSVGATGVPSNNYVRPGGQNCDNVSPPSPVLCCCA